MTARFRRLWRAPLLLALLTAGGLCSALFGDGIWDALSWLALAIPVIVAAWIFTRRKTGEAASSAAVTDRS